MNDSTPAEPARCAREAVSGRDLDDGALAGLELFRSADLAAVRSVLAVCPVHSVPAGEILIQAGRSNHELYLVLSGRFSVRLKSARSVPIVYLESGEVVGEVSLVDGQPTSACVVAESDSRVLALEHERLWALAGACEAVSANLLATLVKRLRFVNETVFRYRERLEQYRQHATADSLTGLFNRRWLDEMLPRQMQRSRICREPLSLLLVDVDRFKAYNDRYGHVAGDHALCAVGRSLRRSVRPGDMVARYGGEEFAVVLPNCPLESAKAVAGRLIRAVARVRVTYSYGEPLASVTVSVGAAEMSGESTPESFIARADAALYRAKALGRNCLCV